MSAIVAVDLGGTHIRAAFFPTPKPPPATQSKGETHASEGPEAVIQRMIKAIEAQIPDTPDELRIGVGAPGPLDPERGLILDAPNLNDWVNIPLRARLEQHFGCKVVIGNDANMAALGEWRFGAGEGSRYMVYLTISTGIGGGIIDDGKLLTGAHGLAAELGHMQIDPDGPLCGCGHRGHVEAMAAGPALARRATEKLIAGRESSLKAVLESQAKLSAEDVGHAALEGDVLALEAVEETGEILGRFLASLAHALNPEVFVIGGGVARIGVPLFHPIRRSLEKHVMHPAYLDGLRIVPAALGDDAGLVGAMVLADQS